ncbi:uncharacterized protein [Rutidosis leptorrhynchoides]|uniref:uncharacterized protein n=1 Tax=Rutidosis leptorrhynchoides TaxID=125765 RepID=UPI003A999D4E
MTWCLRKLRFLFGVLEIKGRLPVQTELDKRGIDLQSVRCLLCDGDVESVTHSLLTCVKVYYVWQKVLNWWGFNGITYTNLEELLQGNTPHIATDSGQGIWQSMIWTSGYLIWKNRNQAVFKNKSWSPPVALSEIQSKSYEWIGKRIKGKHIDWHNWFHNPSDTSAYKIVKD